MKNADIIRVRGLEEGLPTTLLDGELLIDPAGPFLHFQTNAGLEALPLDVQAVPKSVRNVALTCVQGAHGLVYAPLTGGGGGPSFDDGDWRVPGLMPHGAADLSITLSGATAPLSLAEATTLTGVRLDIDAAGGTFGLRAADGTTLISRACSAGVQTLTCAIPLTPGVYIAFVTPASATTVHGMLGSTASGDVVAPLAFTFG